jgi:hypothetical protein
VYLVRWIYLAYTLLMVATIALYVSLIRYTQSHRWRVLYHCIVGLAVFHCVVGLYTAIANELRFRYQWGLGAGVVQILVVWVGPAVVAHMDVRDLRRIYTQAEREQDNQDE